MSYYRCFIEQGVYIGFRYAVAWREWRVRCRCVRSEAKRSILVLVSLWSFNAVYLFILRIFLDSNMLDIMNESA